MGIVQSCFSATDRKDYDKEKAPSFHAQVIEGKIRKRLERYTELYDVLEQENKTLKLIINDEVYEAQLPLIQDDPVIVHAPRSPFNRSFINLDQTVNTNNQSFYSHGNKSEYYDDKDDAWKLSISKKLDEEMESEVFDTQEEEKEFDESKHNKSKFANSGPKIQEEPTMLGPPPQMTLDVVQSHKAGIFNNKVQKKEEQLQVNSNSLFVPTMNEQKRKSRILKMQTGAGIGAEQLMEKRKNQQNSQKYDPNTLHLAYVFASPLVLEVSKGFLVEDKLDEISFKEEFDYITDALEQTKQEVRYTYQLATHQNMSDVLSQKPLTLHFSGHGLINKRETFKDIAHAEYHKEVTKKGNVLVMEGPEGGNSDLFFGENLKQLLLYNKTNFKFVVVASCHSEEIGKIFQMGGAEHVICVKTEKELNDKAAVTFSREFYKAIYRKDISICEAYKIALTALDGARGLQNESKDYILLVQGDKASHVCKSGEMAQYVREGRPKQINEQMKLKIVPPNVTSWVPRSLDTYQCIQKLFSEDSRIVQVFGIPGSGKSAILLKAANYLAERGTYIGGIVYANFQNYKNVRRAFMELIDIIETHNENQFKQLDVNKNMDDKQIMDHLNIYVKGGERMLFILDNMDDLITNDGDRLVTYLNNLVRPRKNLRVLFSASVFVEKELESFIIKNIKNLVPKKARDLFIKKIPMDEARTRFFSIESMLELEKFTKKDSNLRLVEELLGINPAALSTLSHCGKYPCGKKAHKSIEDCGKQYLEKHPLFEILNQPLSICLAAAQLKNQQLSIKTIYENLIKANQMKSGLDCSLIVSYMSAFQMLGQKSKYALEILYVISQTAIGLTKLILQEMFQQLTTEQLEENLLLLEDTSMIVYDSKSENYKVQNIIGKFIEISLSDNQESRVKYNRMIASFYLDFLTTNKQYVHNGTEDLKHLIEITDYWEKNIIKCLSYLISLRFQGRGEDLEKHKTQIQQDKNIHNKNYAQFIAKSLSMRFSQKKTQNEKQKDNKTKKRAGFANKFSATQEIQETIDEIMEPIEGTNSLLKFNTFRKQETILHDVSPKNMGPKNDQEMNSFKQEVRKHVYEDLRAQALYGGSSFPDMIIEEESDDRNAKSNNVISDEFQMDWDMEEEYHYSDEDQNSPQEEQKQINQDNVINIGSFQPRDSQNNNDDDNNARNNFPTVSVFGTDKSWTEAKQTNSAEKKSGSLEIQVSNLGNLIQNKKDQQKAQRQASSVGKKMFGGLFKSSENNNNSEVQKTDLSKRILQIISTNINEKLRKLNDQVTVQEAQQYKETVNKFSQFIGSMMKPKPTKAVDEYLNKAQRQWSRRPTSKNLNKQASTVNPQFRKNQSVAGKKDQDKSLNNLVDSPQRDSNGRPVEVYGNTLGLGLPKGKIQKQTSRVSNKSSGINKQGTSVSKHSEQIPPLLALDQFESGISIGQKFGFSIEEPDEDDTEMGNYSDEEAATVDDGFGEMQILLYHFMSIQALKNREIKDFINLKTHFLIDQMDPMFQASIELLIVFQHLKQKTNHQYAATELDNLLKLYMKEQSQKGQAIVYYFLGYVYKNIGTFAAMDRAKDYLNTALELFKNECDEEGQFYCQKLMVMVQPKTIKESQQDLSTKFFNDGEKCQFDTSLIQNLEFNNNSFNPRDIKSPTYAQVNGIVYSPRSTSNGVMTQQSIAWTNNSFRYKLIKDRESLNLLVNPVDLNKLQNFP